MQGFDIHTRHDDCMTFVSVQNTRGGEEDLGHIPSLSSPRALEASCLSHTAEGDPTTFLFIRLPRKAPVRHTILFPSIEDAPQASHCREPGFL